MAETKIKNKIEIKSHYDKDADVFYVSFGENEPTYIENIDDFLLLEVGWFSKLPRGFRILGPKYHKIKQVKLELVIKQIEKQARQLIEKQRKQIESQIPLYASLHN